VAGGSVVKAVFLSASVPDPQRHPRYHRTGDVVAIRDATEALVRFVLPRGMLVWGGHPAIAPFVRHIAEELGLLNSVETWQSEYFRDKIPKDTQRLPDIQWSSEGETRETSLLRMREEMLSSHPIVAGIFIGGMEGVEEESDLLRRSHPECPVFHLGSTGGAARFLWESNPNRNSETQWRLGTDLKFDLLFEDILSHLFEEKDVQ